MSSSHFFSFPPSFALSLSLSLSSRFALPISLCMPVSSSINCCLLGISLSFSPYLSIFLYLPLYLSASFIHLPLSLIYLPFFSYVHPPVSFNSFSISKSIFLCSLLYISIFHSLSMKSIFFSQTHTYVCSPSFLFISQHARV